MSFVFSSVGRFPFPSYFSLQGEWGCVGFLEVSRLKKGLISGLAQGSSMA